MSYETFDFYRILYMYTIATILRHPLRVSYINGTTHTQTYTHFGLLVTKFMPHAIFPFYMQQTLRKITIIFNSTVSRSLNVIENESSYMHKQPIGSTLKGRQRIVGSNRHF